MSSSTKQTGTDPQAASAKPLMRNGLPWYNKTLRNKNSGQEPQAEPATKASGKQVNFVALFNSVSIEKDYDEYTIIHDGRRLLKRNAGSSENLVPEAREVEQFRADAAEAAKTDGRISEFLRTNKF